MVDGRKARLRYVVGDITTLAVDAIVNAANEALAPGGGVCGAIHRAAGPGLAEECSRLAPCPTGEARVTSAYDLQTRYVIHAVGPVWRGGGADEDALLSSCYRSALELARERDVRSIAFPAISTGIYGFPIDRATRIAVRTVREWLAVEPVLDEVIFAVLGPEAEAAYRAELAPS